MGCGNGVVGVGMESHSILSSVSPVEWELLELLPTYPHNAPQDTSAYRWRPVMGRAGVPRSQWRKSWQWFMLTADHAQLVVSDNAVHWAFERFCNPSPDETAREGGCVLLCIMLLSAIRYVAVCYMLCCCLLCTVLLFAMHCVAGCCCGTLSMMTVRVCAVHAARIHAYIHVRLCNAWPTRTYAPPIFHIDIDDPYSRASPTPPRFDCYSDEHYIPTLLSVMGRENETSCQRTITNVDWRTGGAHPRAYTQRDISSSRIRSLRQPHKRCGYTTAIRCVWGGGVELARCCRVQHVRCSLCVFVYMSRCIAHTCGMHTRGMYIRNRNNNVCMCSAHPLCIAARHVHRWSTRRR